MIVHNGDELCEDGANKASHTWLAGTFMYNEQGLRRVSDALKCCSHRDRVGKSESLNPEGEQTPVQPWTGTRKQFACLRPWRVFLSQLDLSNATTVLSWDSTGHTVIESYLLPMLGIMKGKGFLSFCLSCCTIHKLAQSMSRACASE